MGLPVWRAPSPADVRVAATKTDASAAARSPIRRRSPASARPRRAGAQSDGNGFSRRYISLADFALRQGRHAALGRESERSPRPQERERERERERVREQERVLEHFDFDTFLRTDPDDWIADLSSWPAPTDSRNQTRSPEDRVRLYISSDVPSIHASRLGAQTRPALSERETSSGPDRTRARESLERNLRDTRRTAELSRPTHIGRPHAGRTSQPLGELPRHTYRRANSNWDNFADTSDDAALMDATRDLPPLRRMGRRQVTDGPLPSSSLRESWSPASPIDGLGDRERSLSPPTSDHWETMLTTITPDTQLPSVDSSFTSAAASASFSASNDNSQASSISSPRTHVTIPSRRESPDETSALLPQRACDTDEDMSENDTESDERTQPTRRRNRGPYRSSFRLPHDMHLLPDMPPRRDPSAYSSSVRSRSRDTTAFVRNYYSFVDRAPPGRRFSPSRSSRSTPMSFSSARYRLQGDNGNGEEERSLENRRDSGVGSNGNASANGSSEQPAETYGSSMNGNAQTSAAEESQNLLDPELETMREILERLARRGDVPEEFWLSAGLTPPVQEATERARREQRERGRL